MNGRSRNYRDAEYTILVLILIFVPLMIFVGARLVQDGERYLEKQQLVDDLHQQLHVMDGILLVLQEAETGQRGFLLTGREEYLHPYLRASETLDAMMADIPSVFKDEPDLQEKFKKIDLLARKKLASLKLTIDLARSSGAEVAIEVLRSGTDRAIMRELRTVINGIRVRQTASLNIEFTKATNRQASTRRYAILLFVLLIGFAALTVYIALRDVRLKRKLAEQLRQDSYHDPLTALPNRRYLEEMLSHTIAGAARKGNDFALIYVDLDGFKQINDQYGHGVGDKLLTAVGQRFNEAVRKADMVARLGGDEFAILMPSLNSPDEAILLAGRIAQAIDMPLIGEQPDARVTASVGIAFYPRHGQTAEQLLLHADQQMYGVKHSHYRQRAVA